MYLNVFQNNTFLVAQLMLEHSFSKFFSSVVTFLQVQYLLQLAAQQGTLGGLPSAPQLGPTQQIQIFPQGGGPPQTIQIAAPQPTHNFLAPQVPFCDFIGVSFSNVCLKLD